MTAPRRLRVVGTSGAGKTTFARAVAARLGLAHLELDELFWDSGWTFRAPDDVDRRLAEFLAADGADGWVACGNWASKLDGRFGDYDALVWLDYSRARVMARVIWRTLVRVVTRRELWHGNRERLANLFSRDPEDNIVLWSWTSFADNRERYAEQAATDPRVVRLRSPREARHWLDALG
ncbi:putative adenylate kinase [Xylanimonas cellulosilytica DSM 15894]|uniref:Adenylate kinase n=1 Tax=Xylanimonas cellulosilytica (strain DSM 15894 / JCM 12276 / CECT 5975 / KCTC 9989 / LMG 20990 / NBRC 107835 / XIL07) TaxID=446471 RepID=D1BS77_XYLCX|nr:toxin [Xylanimonas cellulosilytica]ACZ30569.1 putative adenylate kinase [Xylanimonas cellulosilytica DSM 15894]